MLDDFLNILKGVTEVARNESRDREALFHKVVQPLFVEVQPLVDDYLALFLLALETLESGSADLSDSAIASIRERRRSMAAARQQVREFAKTVDARVLHETVQSFARHTLKFFQCSLTATVDASSGSAQLVDVLDVVASGQLPPADAALLVKEALDDLSRSWMRMARSYAAARLELMTPDRFTRARRQTGSL